REKYQINAFNAQGRKADDNANHASNDAPNRKRQRKWQPHFLCHDRRGIGSNCHKTSLAERNLPSLERGEETVGSNNIDAREDQNRLRVVINETAKHVALILARQCEFQTGLSADKEE